jgi:hypothetical protein
MTKQFDDSNRGKVWKNDRKEKDTDADFTGSQNVVCPKCNNPTDYWVNAWKRKDGANPKAPALSWSTRAKDGGPARKPSEKTAAEEMDDEIPF